MSARRGPRGDLPTWPGLLNRLLAREDLSAADTAWAMREVMTGEATPAQIAGFVVALRAKGESPEEVAGLAASMLEQATPVSLPRASVDIVGTGGDGAHTVNISTMAAVVTAATGVPVAKHGNRAASSSSGAADVLEALGVVIDLPAAGVARCVEEAGIGFFFAPVFHPGMRHAGADPPRDGHRHRLQLPRPADQPRPPGGGRGRLRRPAHGAGARVASWPRGAPAPWCSAVTTGWTSSRRRRRHRCGSCGAARWSRTGWTPTVLGLATPAPGALRGGDPAVNADVFRRVLAGEPGPVRDAVLLNAAAALAAFDERAQRLHDALEAGIARAAEAVDDGRAAALLERWVTVSRNAADRG